jgi:hypothetical protein
MMEYNQVKCEYLYKVEVLAANLNLSMFCAVRHITAYIATTAL